MKLPFDPRKPPDEATQRALRVVADALREVPKDQVQNQVTLIAVIAIAMIHGTYGKAFCREFLAGARTELDLPNGFKIELELKDKTSAH